MAKVAKASRKSSSGTLAKQSTSVRIESSMTEKQAEVRNEKETAMYRKFVPQVEKRDSKIVPFDFDKLVQAIYKAMLASNEGSYEEARAVAHRVMAEVVRIAKKYKNFMPTVEGFQDSIEKELILGDYVTTSKSYILYRNERSKLRTQGVSVPAHVRELSEKSSAYFRDNKFGEFIYLRTYAKWIDAEGRRETWIETVDRYLGFMKENLGDKLTSKEYSELRDAILKHEIMPSMRLMQFSGNAARRCNVTAYNCSFIAPSKVDDFAEIMYVSMCGTGVGYSVESQNIQELPQIKFQVGDKLPTHIVEDSKEGWCNALTLGLKTWYAGRDVDFDYSQIRPAGARLKTMGGKASGPEPLRQLLAFARQTILARQGKRLTNLQAHDIICKIGDCVVAGGVRRSAMISLSDLDDEDIRDAKKGQFYLTHPHRSIANNSAVYDHKPTTEEFLDEWVALMKSGAGERGIFNRGGLSTQLPKRRIEYFKERGYVAPDGNIRGTIGTNPCGEIILQSKQFCNLTEVVCRATDTRATLLRKMRLATILGTYQSTLTNFQYLSKEWKENCEAERLLGVSLTGQWDSKAVRDAKVLDDLRDESIKVNKKYASRFGVNASTAITCVKPSGTVSQMLNCASGMHARHSPYYIRRVRISATDSLFKLMKDQGVPFYPEVGQTMESANTFVLEFPVKSPEGSVYRDALSALDQLEHWKLVKENYTEHNPSVTVSVGPNEWLGVAHWLYENWEIIGGLSFLPRFDHVYQLAPFEEIDEKRFLELTERFNQVDYSKLITYERQDETEMKKELACAGGTCEIV